MGSMKYKTNALYSIDPLQAQKWAHKTIEPFVNQNQASLATHIKKPVKAMFKPFQARVAQKDPSHREAI